MDILEELKKDDDSGVIWLDTPIVEEQITVYGKSEDMPMEPFNMMDNLFIIIKDNKLYLKFGCDDECNNLIEIDSVDSFKTIFKLYTKKHKKKEGLFLQKTLRKNFKQPNLKWENYDIYFAGFATYDDFCEFENMFTLNSYISKKVIQQGTAYWLQKSDLTTSAYKTFYSHSIIMIELHTAILLKDSNNEELHPMFLKLNYPTIDHKNGEEKLPFTKMPIDLVEGIIDVKMFEKEFIEKCMNNYEEGDNKKIWTFIFNYVN